MAGAKPVSLDHLQPEPQSLIYSRDAQLRAGTTYTCDSYSQFYFTKIEHGIFNYFFKKFGNIFYIRQVFYSVRIATKKS